MTKRQQRSANILGQVSALTGVHSIAAAVFFEYHSVKGKPQRLGAMLEIMSSKGFRYAINGCHTAARPFVETMPHGFDLQLNVSCFR